MSAASGLLAAAALALAQTQPTDPVGPAGWNLRNWLGLACQVTVFILLVAFIFWLADLGDDDAAADPLAKPDEAAPGPPAEPPADESPAT